MCKEEGGGRGGGRGNLEWITNEKGLVLGVGDCI